MQNSAAGADLEIERRLPEVEGPEEARRQDAAVEVAQLRPRTGVEQVDSYQRERAVMGVAVDDVIALERANIGLEVVGRAVAGACPTW